MDHASFFSEAILIEIGVYNSFYESLINFITIDFIHVLHSRSLLFPVMFKGGRVRELAARP